MVPFFGRPVQMSSRLFLYLLGISASLARVKSAVVSASFSRAFRINPLKALVLFPFPSPFAHLVPCAGFSMNTKGPKQPEGKH